MDTYLNEALLVLAGGALLLLGGLRARESSGATGGWSVEMRTARGALMDTGAAPEGPYLRYAPPEARAIAGGHRRIRAAWDCHLPQLLLRRQAVGQLEEERLEGPHPHLLLAVA